MVCGSPEGGPSLGPRNALVNAQLFVAGPRFAGGAAAGGQGEDTEHADRVAERKGDDASGLHRLAGLLDTLAVDTDVAGVDQPLREGAALHQADAVEVAVDAQAASA